MWLFIPLFEMLSVNVLIVHICKQFISSSYAKYRYIIIAGTRVKEWQIQEFQNRGHGRILGVWVLFSCLFTATLCVYSDSRDKVHIANITCWKWLKYMHVIRQKLQKQTKKSSGSTFVKSTLFHSKLLLVCHRYI